MKAESEIAAGEAALREAIARRDFAAAAASATRYARAVGGSLPELSPAARGVRLRKAAQVLQWARHNLLAARARIASDLRATVRIGHAPPAPTTALHSWHLDA